MLNRAIEMKEQCTRSAKNFEEFQKLLSEEKPGFVKAMWCGDTECELTIKDKTGGVTSRCIPEEQENISDKCVCCGKPAKHMVYWGRAY
jgi:prolyl-tRNA synthetase